MAPQPAMLTKAARTCCTSGVAVLGAAAIAVSPVQPPPALSAPHAMESLAVDLAAVIDPTIVRTIAAPLTVELTGTSTLGMTVADLRAPAPAGCTTHVAMDLDVDRFWSLVVDALTRIGHTEF